MLLISLNSKSQNCLGTQNYTITPAGPYSPGQTVTVTYTLNNFIQVNINWIIAFDIDYGTGWASVNPVSAPGNPGGSNGSWIWDVQNTYPSGLNFGPGYRFQNNGNANWGTSSTGPFTLSFSATVGSSCNPQDLSLSIKVIGDCQTGGWNNGACCNIIPYNIYNGTSNPGNGNMLTTSTVSEISCNGYNDGGININVSGGNAPFIYNWDNGSTSQNISGLTAGTYSITITDNIGCITNESYTLTDPPPFLPTINSSDITCFGNNDGIIEVINEPSSTSYLWSNTATSSSITNLATGNYSVDVIDINNCVFDTVIQISEPAELNVNCSANNISCNGDDNGNISFSISGGVTNYIIDMPPFNDTLFNGLTTYTKDSLSQGVYNYSVIDANGCFYSDFVIINEPTSLETNPLVSNVVCNGQANGTIVLNTSGGTLPYNENFGGYNPLQLDTGIYSYTVTDSNGCIVSDTFSIIQPDSLLTTEEVINVSCSGYSDGVATLLITGGNLPYNIDWNGYNPNNLFAGTYNYLVTDLNGCISQGQVTISEPPGMTMSTSTTNVSCYNGNDGTAILNILGGTGGAYNVNWGGLNPTALAAGNHIVTVTDSNNCSITDTALITQPSEIIINPIINNVSCNGNEDGNIELQISGGTPPYTETWLGIDPTQLPPGEYTCLVEDGNNCVKNNTFIINEPSIIKVNASIKNVECYGENDGAVNLDIIGGIQPYNIDFGIYDQYALPSGTFNFTVTDLNECVFDSTIFVEEGNEIFLDFIATSPICRYSESTLSINISNSDYNLYTMILEDSILKTFEIDTNGNLIQNGLPIKLTPNYSGKVTIISLTDEEGCKRVLNDDVHIEVKQLPELALNIDDRCVGDSSFNLNQATPYGGTYFINNEASTMFDVENLEIGNYIFRYEYTDPLTSCFNDIQEIITISQSPEANIAFSPQPANISDPEIYFTDNSNTNMSNSVWDLGDGNIIYDEINFWHYYESAGEYIIKYYITNEYNCTDSVIENLIINPEFNIYIPNAFSPNDDNDNDYFYPSVIGHKTYNIKIYDRWGGIIYNEDNEQWNGTSNGKLMPRGTYSYTITIYDYKNKLFVYTGLVSLLE